MPKILVVDDEPYIRRCLSFVLAQEGYEVDTAGDGDEGWNKLVAEPPDAVFLDLMLPRRNGYDLCHDLRQHEALAGTVVVMLTARGQESDRLKGLELGADAYCTKPFSPREVTTLLRELLARAGSATSAAASTATSAAGA